MLATVDNVSGYYLLDTGNAGGIVLTAPFVKEHHLFPKGGPIYRSPGGVGGGYSETRAAAKTFAFAGQTYRDVPVGIPQVTSGFFATRGVAGNLGSGFLSRFTVVFDYRRKPSRSFRIVTLRCLSAPTASGGASVKKISAILRSTKSCREARPPTPALRWATASRRLLEIRWRQASG